MTRFATCLWYAREAEEAARFYTGLLPASAMGEIKRAPADYPLGGRAGQVLMVDFTLGDQRYLALNGVIDFPFTPAASMHVTCADQAEVDRCWNALVADGGEESRCGWCKDRWGLSWQIVPRRLTELLDDPDPARASRAMQAMLGMTRIDVAALEAAAEGSRAPAA